MAFAIFLKALGEGGHGSGARFGAQVIHQLGGGNRGREQIGGAAQNVVLVEGQT